MGFSSVFSRFLCFSYSADFCVLFGAKGTVCRLLPSFLKRKILFWGKIPFLQQKSTDPEWKGALILCVQGLQQMCDHGIGNRHTLLGQMQSALLKLQITWNQGFCKAQQGIP